MPLHALEAATHAEILSFLTPRREFSLRTIRDRSLYVYCVWCHPELGDHCESARESSPIVAGATGQFPDDP
jgi:hypothetical protein